MPERAFPVVYAQDVTLSARFYGALVHDLEQEVEHLLGARAAILREPEQPPWGEPVAYVADPAGNPVALADAGLV